MNFTNLENQDKLQILGKCQEFLVNLKYTKYYQLQ